MSKQNRSRKANRKGRSRGRQKKSNNRTYALIGVVVVVAIPAVAVLVLLDSGSGESQVATEDTYQTKSLGASDAAVVVVEYSDFQCPYCRQFATGAGEQLRDEYVEGGDVRFVYRHLAFIGPESTWAAEAAECAEAQGRFWDYHDKLFEQQGAENSGAFSKGQLKRFAAELELDQQRFDTCLDSGEFEGIVEAEVEQAQRRRISSTPSILVNGQLVEGAASYQVLQAAVEGALRSP